MFTQLVVLVGTVAWTAIVTFVIRKIVDAIVSLRVSEEEETNGLDISQHEQRVYNACRTPDPSPVPRPGEQART